MRAQSKSQGGKKRSLRSPSRPPRAYNPAPARPEAEGAGGHRATPQWLQDQSREFVRPESMHMAPGMSVRQRAEASRAYLEAPWHSTGSQAGSSTDPAPEPVAGATGAAAAPEPAAGAVEPMEKISDSVRQKLTDWHRITWAAHRHTVATKPAAGDPFRQTFLVEGRPTQILVITHPEATVEEQVPYLAHMCWPLPAVELFGRSARTAPACRTEHAVMHWWKAPWAEAVKLHKSNKKQAFRLKNIRKSACRTCWTAGTRPTRGSLWRSRISAFTKRTTWAIG